LNDLEQLNILINLYIYTLWFIKFISWL
jgi:hypothetical protein